MHRAAPLLLRDRNYRLLFTAGALTNLGDGMIALALPWLASLMTRDAAAIAAVAAAGRLLSPLVENGNGSRNSLQPGAAARALRSRCRIGLQAAWPQRNISPDRSAKAKCSFIDEGSHPAIGEQLSFPDVQVH